MRTLIFDVHKPQADFLALRTKFRAFVGGYGSGKTFIGCTGIVQHALTFPGIPQAYFAPTFSQIRNIFYPSIEEVADKFELSVVVKIGVHEVNILDGSEILSNIKCLSMERPEQIVGFKIGHCLIDELDVMSTDKALVAWQKIIARLRWKGAMNGVDVTTTPEGFKTTYNLFVQAIQKNPGLSCLYGLVKASTRDNAGNLPEGYISSLIDTYPSELVNAYVDGEFVNLTSGTVYRSYNRITNNSNETVEDDDDLHIGIDFNIGHMSGTVYVIRPTGWHAVHEFKNLLDTPDIILAIKAKFPDRFVYAYPDATGSNREAVDASKSDISLLRLAGFKIRAHHKNPSVRGRILSTNKQFEKKMLWINASRCPTVARCLEQQSYNAQGEPDKESGTDHQNDATSYPIAYMFPIIQPVRSQFISGV